MFTTPALQRFIDDELGRSPELVARVLAGTLQSLRDFREAANGGERSDGLELLTNLQRQGERFQQRMLESLTRGTHELASTPADPVVALKPGIEGLALMDESRVDDDIAISHATHAIEAAADWELRELLTFTSTLAGLEHVSAASNPFRPLLYASALWDATCAIAQAPFQRSLLLRLSSEVTAQLLKRTWAAACSRLEELGVQPCTYRTVVLPGAGSLRAVASPAAVIEGLSNLLAKVPGTGPLDAGSQAGNRDPYGSQAEPQAGAAVSTPSQRFDDVLRRLESALCAPGRPPGSAAAHALAPSARLESYRQELVESAGSSQNGRVIEMLARVFETIFTDPALAPPFRQVIARLQVAALRLAMQNPGLMQSNKHPVWLLVDRIGELSSAYRLPDDPRLLAMQAFCEKLASDIAQTPAPDAELFRRGLARLEAWLHEQAQAAVAAAQPVIDALARAEQRTVLETRFLQQFEATLARTSVTPGIRRFVVGVWMRVVVDAVLRPGATPETEAAHLQTLDDLLWSVQLPDHPQSRQRLLSVLPSLLKRLQAGMDAVELPRAEQQVFLDELMRIHAEALRPGTRIASSPVRQPATGPGEHPGGAGKLDFLDDYSFPEGAVIDCGSMDTVPADMFALPAEAPAKPAPAVITMRPFERRRLFIQGRWNHCQLLWRSEHAHYFLFAGDAADRTHSLTRSALERMHAAGLLLPMQSKPLLQRAVDHLARQRAVS